MLLRGWIVPVGDAIPDRRGPERSTPAKYLLKLSNARNAPPRQVSTYASEFVPPSLAQPFPFPSPLQCSCVGGSFRSGMQSPTGADRNDPPPPNICLSSQTTGTLPPAKYPPTLPNSSTPPLPNPSHFPRPSNALAWVDHSGRGLNPRPAQGRNAPPLLVAEC